MVQANTKLDSQLKGVHMEHNIMNAKALMMDVINRKEHPELYKGFKTGYQYIDNLTGGFYPGQLITISSYEFLIICS